MAGLRVLLASLALALLLALAAWGRVPRLPPPRAAAAPPPTPPGARPAALPGGLFFAVVAPPYTESSGGTTVLHALVDRLNRRFSARGEPSAAFIVPWGQSAGSPTNSGYATPGLPAWIDPRDGVVVYPEIIFGNPLQAQRVVRWMLYFPGANSGPDAASYDASEDLIACYAMGVCAELAHKDPFHLRVTDYYPDHYRGLPGGDRRPRKGTIYFARKSRWRAGNRTVAIPKVDPAAEARARGAFLLSKDEGKRRRLELFSRAELFVTRDPLTFRAVEAASAGCPAVVEKVPGVTKEEWLATAEDDYKYGIAYGEEDLPSAKSTLGLVRDHLKRRREEEEGHVDELVRRVLRKWYPDAAEQGPSEDRSAAEDRNAATDSIVDATAYTKAAEAPAAPIGDGNRPAAPDASDPPRFDLRAIRAEIDRELDAGMPTCFRPFASLLPEGWTLDSECCLLFILARRTRGNVYEQGPYRGRSTVCIAKGIQASGVPGRTFVTADLFPVGADTMQSASGFPESHAPYYWSYDNATDPASQATLHSRGRRLVSVPGELYRTHPPTFRETFEKHGGQLSYLRSGLARAGVLEDVTVVAGETVPDLGYELVWTDAAHGEEEIAAHAKDWGRFLRSDRGTVFAFHDVGNSEGNKRAVERAMEVRYGFAVGLTWIVEAWKKGG